MKRFGTHAHALVYRPSGGRILGRLGGQSVLLLQTVGRRTGQTRTTPVQYLPQRQGRVAIHELAHALGVSSTRFGRERAEAIVECAAFIVAAGLHLATDGESIPYVAGRGKDGALAAVTEAAELIDEIARRIEDTIASYLEEPGDGEAAAAA